MNPEFEAGATHFLLSHISVKPGSWILRREFPIAPTFRPSGKVLPYTEMDTACRRAIHEHLRNINGGEGDPVAVNWALESCWRLNDTNEWFSFALVLLCCPIARALRGGKVHIPDPKPRVLHHIATTDTMRTSYTLEYSMPISTTLDPGAFTSMSPGAFGPTLIIDYDTVDPGARQAIQQIIDRANHGVTDMTRKPWGLCLISRLNKPPLRLNATAAERDLEKRKTAYAIVLEWQPGPVESQTHIPLAPAALDGMATVVVTQPATTLAHNLPHNQAHQSSTHILPPSYTPTP
ncbi:hypothetical protein M408DRAFT_330199 [Serendipita vermifera MAFF 305830]|uniref:Uncharacterized protein n=1 Tax=Serendipita vermifera MAFF 305830 TaxID=933852 RepID=A0A0C3B4B5_SERVB|nr:hypothetical protein M408DRAFT_330199 [Serendipita vermifera MAFF 305830]